MRNKNKLEKFSENRQAPNVIEIGKPLFEEIRGKWSQFFRNDNEIAIELACGRGEYTVGLAEAFPNQNFIGIDIKGDRIWSGSQYAIKNSLKNVAFLRTQISYLEDFFEEGEVAELWLTFPDPRPKDRDEKHRLTNKFYLSKYQRVLKKEGWFKFKTDSTFLFQYTLEVLESLPIKDLAYTFDLYHSEFLDEHYGLKTKYEGIWVNRGEQIKYLKFRF